MDATLRFIMFLGLPGSGKGQQVKLFERRLARLGHTYDTVTVGDYLRKKIQGSDTQFSWQIARMLHAGTLVPEVMPIMAFVETLFSTSHTTRFIITDGVGRRLRETEMVLELLEVLPKKAVDVFFLAVSESTAIERALMRGRRDDTREIVQKRIREYHEQTLPSVEYLQDVSGVRFNIIDGEGTKQQVHQRVMRSVVV